MPYISESMQRLDTWSNAILSQSNLPALVSRSVDGDLPEHTAAQSIRAISRIKLSRFVLIEWQGKLYHTLTLGSVPR